MQAKKETNRYPFYLFISDFVLGMKVQAFSSIFLMA